MDQGSMVLSLVRALESGWFGAIKIYLGRGLFV